MTQQYLYQLQQTGNEEYFRAAENDAEFYFNKYIYPFVPDIDGKVILELACGHGRMTNQILKKNNPFEIILVDINVDNIFFCEDRFKSREGKFSFIKNDGLTLKEVKDSSVDFLFSFDSMVHFNFELMRKYEMEIERVLIKGGRAFIHYSNCDDVDGEQMGHGLRGSMNNDAMLRLLTGLRIIHDEVIDWSGVKDLDAIIVFEK